MDHGIGGLRLQRLGLLNSGVVALWMTYEELLGLVRRSVESRGVKVKVQDGGGPGPASQTLLLCVWTHLLSVSLWLCIMVACFMALSQVFRSSWVSALKK